MNSEMQSKKWFWAGIALQYRYFDKDSDLKELGNGEGFVNKGKNLTMNYYSTKMHKSRISARCKSYEVIKDIPPM
jgi:hypothetical protein